jgi:hypothetical protein
MKSKEEIEQLAEQIANKHSKQNGEIIGNPRAIMLGTEAIQAVKDGYTQCQEDMAIEIAELKIICQEYSKDVKALNDMLSLNKQD